MYQGAIDSPSFAQIIKPATKSKKPVTGILDVEDYTSSEIYNSIQMRSKKNA